MGKEVANLLLKTIESEDFSEVETIVLSGKLNVRESSLKHNIIT